MAFVGLIINRRDNDAVLVWLVCFGGGAGGLLPPHTDCLRGRNVSGDVAVVVVVVVVVVLDLIIGGGKKKYKSTFRCPAC